MSNNPNPLAKLTRRDRKRLRRQWRQLAAGIEIVNPHPMLHDADVKRAIENESARNAPTVKPRSGQVVARGESDWRKPITGTVPSVARSDNWGGYFGGAHKFCRHPADHPVIDMGEGVTLYAGARSDTLYARDWALIVDLSGINYDLTYSGPAGFDSLRAHVVEETPLITLGWPDYGLPPVRFEFWPELVRLLPKGKTLVRCVGGHGRTGTALAAILIVAWDYSAHAAIATVRKHHCNSAVESMNQKSYLNELAAWWFAKQGLPVADPEPITPTVTAPSVTVDMASVIPPESALTGDWLCDECSEYFLTTAECVAHGQSRHAMTLPQAVKNALYDPPKALDLGTNERFAG